MFKLTRQLDGFKQLPKAFLRQRALEIMEETAPEIVEKIKAKYYSSSKRFKHSWKHKVDKRGENATRTSIWNDKPFAVQEKTVKLTPAQSGGKLYPIPLDPALKRDGSKLMTKGPTSFAKYRRGGERQLRPVAFAGKKWLTRVNKQGKIISRPWYLLKENVTIPARTPGLRKFVEKQYNDMFKKIGKEIELLTGGR